MFNRTLIFWKLTVSLLAIIILALTADFLLMRFDVLTERRGLQVFLVGLIALVISGGGAWFIIRRFVRQPLDRLAEGMRKLANQEDKIHFEEDEPGETGSIDSSFNLIASKLAAYQAELRNNKVYLEGILESTADLIITVTPAGKILSFNKGAENALGYDRQQVIGQPIEMLFENPADRTYAIGQLEFSDNVINYETRFKARDGTVKEVLLTLTRLRDQSGEVISTFGISKDITREKRLQKELIQSQRLAAIGEVFAGVQHSLKNMLNACKGGAYMVRIGFKNDDRDMLSEGWDIVQQGITRMADMSVYMLNYVKEWKPSFETVDLGGILSEISRIILPAAAKNQVRFKFNPSHDLPLVSCDSQMIHSATMDIVSNALDACHWKDYPDGEEPEVTLGAYYDEASEMVTIEVADNGCGMSNEIIKKIFTPFFSTKSKTGTGLGLAMTARMVEAHHGKFDIESKIDKGTVFRILLPINRNNYNKESLNGKESTNS